MERNAADTIIALIKLLIIFGGVIGMIFSLVFRILSFLWHISCLQCLLIFLQNLSQGFQLLIQNSFRYFREAPFFGIRERVGVKMGNRTQNDPPKISNKTITVRCIKIALK